MVINPGRGADQVSLRLPDGMRDRLKDVAAANGRSLNAEIVQRLEASLEPRLRLSGASFEDEDGNLYVRADPLLIGDVNLENAITSVRMAVEDLQQLVDLARKAEVGAAGDRKGRK